MFSGLAAGRSVIARVEGSRRWCDGVTGFLVAPEMPKDLPTPCAKLAADGSLSREMGQKEGALEKALHVGANGNENEAYYYGLLKKRNRLPGTRQVRLVMKRLWMF
jgi:hypothetical protein